MICTPGTTQGDRRSENARNTEDNRQSGEPGGSATNLSASTTGVYSSSCVSQDPNPRPQVLRVSVKPLSHIGSVALNLPNNIEKLQQFLGMVQYYGDIWAKRSEMLAPLTDLVGAYGETKPPKRIRLKSYLGGGILSISKHLTMLTLQSQKM